MISASEQGRTSRASLSESLLIVPAAHTALTSTSFQTEMYELFHRTAAARAGHMLGTPAILLGTLGWLDRSTWAPWPGAALMLVVALWGARTDRTAAVITAGLGLGLVALAHVASGVSLVLLFGGCAIQTFSHLFEDVPPPHSGTTRFVPLAEWLRRITAREVVRSTLLTLLVFYWLEMWAAFRIWPLQILHVLMRFGYRPAERRRLDARVREILADPTSDWRRPAR